MDKKIKIILLGSIPKGDEARRDWVDWKEDYIKQIQMVLPNSMFLNGDLIKDDVGPKLVVGHDLWLIKHADVIVVNAETKIGAGTAQEMVVAKEFMKTVVSIIPKNSHHRKSNVSFDERVVKDWIHPFLWISTDYIAENIQEAAKWIRDNLKKKSKNSSVYSQAIKDFEEELPEIYNKYINLGW